MSYGYPYNPQMMGVMPQYGNFYQQPAMAALKETNVLNENQIAELKQKAGKINFLPTREEILRSLCTHRHDGTFSIRPESQDSSVYVCNICGERIDLGANYDHSVIQQLVEYLNGAFNAMKVKNNGTVGNDIMKSLGEAMVLIKRMPGMCEIVDRNFQKVDNAAQGIYQGYSQSAAQASNAILGMAGTPYAPAYNAPGAFPGMMPGMMPQQGGVVLQSQVAGNPFAGPTMVMPNGVPGMQQPMMQPMQQQQVPPPIQGYPNAQQMVMTPYGPQPVQQQPYQGVMMQTQPVMDPMAGNAFVNPQQAQSAVQAAPAPQAQQPQQQPQQQDQQQAKSNIVNSKVFSV